MAQTLTMLARLMVVRSIQEDQGGATLLFQPGNVGRLSRRDATYPASLQLTHRSGERQHPVGVLLADSFEIVDLVRADCDTPDAIFGDDPDRVRVLFQGHDGVFQLKTDHPDFARLRDLLNSAQRRKARVWFLVQRPGLALLDVSEAVAS